MVSPFFDDIKWGRVGCSVTYDASCQSLYITYFLLTGWDAVFAIRGGWGNRGDGLADRP